MPRPERFAPAGVPLHVTQRGNFRAKVFKSEGDCSLYLRLLGRYAGEFGNRVTGYCLMPNHVHLLVQFRGEVGLKKQCFSWKHFTSRAINLALNREGHFWQGESYDHIVRGEAEFDQYRRYIAENPLKAGLRDGFVHWVRP